MDAQLWYNFDTEQCERVVMSYSDSYLVHFIPPGLARNVYAAQRDQGDPEQTAYLKAIKAPAGKDQVAAVLLIIAVINTLVFSSFVLAYVLR